MMVYNPVHKVTTFQSKSTMISFAARCDTPTAFVVACGKPCCGLSHERSMYQTQSREHTSPELLSQQAGHPAHTAGMPGQ